jgi:hypothetical protein
MLNINTIRSDATMNRYECTPNLHTSSGETGRFGSTRVYLSHDDFNISDSRRLHLIMLK